MRIGFLDSGIGGLTLLARAGAELPQSQLIYYADADHLPYGCRSAVQVADYVMQAARHLAACQLDALVLACNTATAVAVDKLRRILDFPIIGMEPAVKPALAACTRRRVLLCATTLTLREHKLSSLLAGLKGVERVDFCALDRLVTLAESNIFEGAAVSDYLHTSLAEVARGEHGALVLGCTHFSYYRQALSEQAGAGVELFDGYAGTLRQLRRKLGLPLPAGDKGEMPGAEPLFIISGRPASASETARFMALMRRAAAEQIADC